MPAKVCVSLVLNCENPRVDSKRKSIILGEWNAQHHAPCAEVIGFVSSSGLALKTTLAVLPGFARSAVDLSRTEQAALPLRLSGKNHTGSPFRLVRVFRGFPILAVLRRSRSFRALGTCFRGYKKQHLRISIYLPSNSNISLWMHLYVGLVLSNSVI